MKPGRSGGSARLIDVAELAGVSIKTVSNVVHDYPHVSDALRAKVQAAIDELGYRPNLTARQLATGRTGMIALAMPFIDQPYFAELAKNIGEEATRRGYRVLMEQTENSVEAERAVIRDREEGLVDGVIFHPVHIDTLEIARMRPDNPLVLLGEAARPLSTDHVMIDNLGAARDAVQLLVGKGRRRIAFLATIQGDITETTQLRLLGYQEALVQAGVPLDADLVLETADFAVDDVARALTDALDRGVEIDAVICREDMFAMAAMRALHEAGLRVPEDVAVLGWDDTPLARFSHPSVSSVAPDKADIAKTAVELLIDRIQGHSGPGRHRIAPHTIIERATT